MKAVAVIRNQRGATTVETAISSIVIVFAISGGLLVSYMGFARVWIERCSYEALVCLGSVAEKAECERRLQSDIEAALPIGSVDALSLSRNSFNARALVHFNIENQRTIRISTSLPLPLRSGAKL